MEANEQEILFENLHIRNKSFFQEFYKKQFSTTKNLVLMGLLFFIMLGGIFMLVFGKDPTGISLIAIPLLGWILIFSIYKQNIKIMSDRQNEIHSPTAEYLTVVTGTGLICKTPNGSVLELSFDKIKRVYRSKNYIYLETAARQNFPFLKMGFTKGTYAQFCNFLSTVNPKFKV